MFSELTEKETEIWRNLVERELAFIQSRQGFISDCRNRVTLIKKGLHNPIERGTALRVIEYLEVEERQCLLDDILQLASVGHSDIEGCRKAILSLPKTWLLENIERSAKPLLKDGTDEEYRRLLELYIEIDRELTETLVRRALQHEDQDIREVGEDFQNYLKNEIAPFDECRLS